MAQICSWLSHSEYADDPHLSPGKSWFLSTLCLLLLPPGSASATVSRRHCAGWGEPRPSWCRGCKPSHPAALLPASSGKAKITLLPSPPGLCLARGCTSAGACVCRDVVQGSSSGAAPCCILGPHCMADISCCVIFHCPLHTSH